MNKQKKDIFHEKNRKNYPVRMQKVKDYLDELEEAYTILEEVDFSFLVYARRAGYGIFYCCFSNRPASLSCSMRIERKAAGASKKM